MAKLPDDLKFIKPFLVRSLEMESAIPLISYYTHLYAVQLAIEYHKQYPKNQVVKQYVHQLLDETEQKKTQLGEVQNAKDQFEAFCTSLFVRADTEDRKQGSTRQTAHTFLVAGYFIEAMRVFEELPPDWEEKRVYCKWKANDINKALKAGLIPNRGGQGEDQAQFLEKQESGNQENLGIESEYDNLEKLGLETPPEGFATSSTHQDISPSPPQITSDPPQPSAFKPTPQPNTFTPTPQPATNYTSLTQPSNFPPPQPQSKSQPAATSSRTPTEMRRILELAKKEAQFAIQELEYKNVGPARKNLENALRALSELP